MSDEPDLPDDDVEDYDDEGPHPEGAVEISGLSLFPHHGVTTAEQEIGQRLVVDLRMEVGEVDATVTDMIEDTIDYGEVCSTVALVAQSRSFNTLERLCAAIADRLIGDFDAERVMVRCAKPEPPIPLPVEEVSVELWRDVGED